MAVKKNTYFISPSTLRSEIYQSNVFLQAQKKFDSLGMRLFLIALSGINPHFSSKDKYYDKEFKQIFIPTAKLSELLGSSKYLGMVPKACLKLALVDVYLANDGERDSKLTNLFKKIDYKPHDGLYVCFNDKMRPYLLDLLYAKKGYTKIPVQYLLKLSSLYAVRLLEIMLQYQNIPHYKMMMDIERKVPIEELRFMLNVPNGAYKNRLDNFKKHVLDIPINEINENTPYFLRYKVIKQGTKIVAFKFKLATHNVPFKIKGKEPKFSNDAIDYLREMGFTDAVARQIFNQCKGVNDCLLRARRADLLLRCQKTRIRNRLGFLRKAIQCDWRMSTMVEREDPYSKPGWSAKIDYHSRRPGMTLRGPNKPVEKPPNYLPSDKMDKRLATAIAQGEFYTPATENEAAETPDKSNLVAEYRTQSRRDLTSENRSTSVSDTSPEYSPAENDDAYRQSRDVATNENEPTTSPEDTATPADEDTCSEPDPENVPPSKTLGGDPYYVESADKRAKLMSKYYSSPEEYQRALDQDFEEEMRELAEKKARAREETVRKRQERIKSGNYADASSYNDSGEMTLLDNIINDYINTHFTPEQLADFRMRFAKMKAKMASIDVDSLQTAPSKEQAVATRSSVTEAPSEPAPPKRSERAVNFTPQPTTNEAVSSTTARPSQSTANETAPPTKLSRLDAALAGIAELTQLYSKINKSPRVTEKDIKQDYQDELKVFNEQKARERGLDENGKIKPPVMPPLPPRLINLPMPPPPPPDFEKTAYRRTKMEKLIQKGLNELVQLHKEANALKEEPADILARTNDGVEPFKTEYDMSNGHDYVYLNDGTRYNLLNLIGSLENREIVWFWRGMLENFAEYKMTPVEVMRKFIKTFGTLPAPHALKPEHEAKQRERYRNPYTGDWESAIDPTKPPQPLDSSKPDRKK